MARSRTDRRVLWPSSEQVASFLRRMAAERQAEAERIGDLIAQLRLQKGWSQEELAHEIGVGVSTISRWERGRHSGAPPNVRKLASALGVEPAALRPVAPDTETQLDRIEAEVNRQGAVLDALVDALETELRDRISASSKQAQQQDRGTHHATDHGAQA